MKKSKLKEKFRERKDLFLTSLTEKTDKGISRVLARQAIRYLIKRKAAIQKNTLTLKRTTDENLEIRDQGFTIPKMLFLCPYKGRASTLFQELAVAKEKLLRENLLCKIFAKERCLEDSFHLFIQIGALRVKFFSSIDQADIIIASPKGLRELLEKEPITADFLSSLEIVYLDRAETLLMQGWELVAEVLDKVCRLPKRVHKVSITRIKDSYLEERPRSELQLILTSHCDQPEFQRVLRLSENLAGKEAEGPSYSEGLLLGIAGVHNHRFVWFEAGRKEEEWKRRRVFFLGKMKQEGSDLFLNPIKRAASKRKTTCRKERVVVVVGQRKEMAHIEEELEDAECSFGAVNEETDEKQARKWYGRFLGRKIQFLLLTERLIYFKGFPLQRCEKIIFYSPPRLPQLFSHICETLGETESRVETVSLFSHFDVFQMKHLLGEERTNKIFQKKRLLVESREEGLCWTFG